MKQIVKKCIICSKRLKNRQKKFCSPKCRDRNNYQKHKKYQALWQKKRRDELASIPSHKKIQCLICKRYYVQLGSHIVQRHNMTAREYREHFDLEVKKGMVPKWFRKLKGDIAIENRTYKNLKIGEKFWFKKGSKIAGQYKRSHITLKRLSSLYKFNKRYEKRI